RRRCERSSFPEPLGCRCGPPRDWHAGPRGLGALCRHRHADAAGPLGLSTCRRNTLPGADQVSVRLLAARHVRASRGDSGMTDFTNGPTVGRRGISEADLWDDDCLDLDGPLSITFGSDGNGEFSLGAVRGDMDLEYRPAMIFFTCAGFDAIDEASGAGTARL